MKYYFHDMERLQFFGLNPNEGACAIAYLICVLWIAEKNAKQIKWLVPLYVLEVAALFCLARTISRGGIVAALIVALMAGLLHEKKVSPLNSRWREMKNELVGYPIWRVLLIILYPGIWGRMAPAYMANDASVGNRFTLWKGALRLYSDAFIEGWGWTKTGVSYGNWIQPISDRIQNNGLVNSFLQIGVAYGGIVLSLVFFYLILGLLNSHNLIRVSRKTRAWETSCRQQGVKDAASNKAIVFLKYSKVIGSVCLLWTTSWIVCSSFSTMLRSSLLVMPVIISILLTFILSKPSLTHILISSGLALTLSIGLYALGLVLNINSSFSIKKNNGVVQIANKNGISGRNCVFYADDCILSARYGKEIRKFIETKKISKCDVIDNADNVNFSKLTKDSNTVLVLAGDSVTAITLDRLKSKVILLSPCCTPNELNKSKYVKQILFPETDPLGYRYLWQSQLFWSAKIQLIPFDKPFETTWSDYIIDF